MLYLSLSHSLLSLSLPLCLCLFITHLLGPMNNDNRTIEDAPMTDDRTTHIAESSHRRTKKQLKLFIRLLIIYWCDDFLIKEYPKQLIASDWQASWNERMLKNDKTRMWTIIHNLMHLCERMCHFELWTGNWNADAIDVKQCTEMANNGTIYFWMCVVNDHPCAVIFYFCSIAHLSFSVGTIYRITRSNVIREKPESPITWNMEKRLLCSVSSEICLPLVLSSFVERCQSSIWNHHKLTQFYAN